MTSPVYPLDPETLFISYADAKDIGAKLASSYKGKNPYDYGCFDNFLPLDVVARVREEALALGVKDPEHASGNEKLKTSFKPDIMPAYSKAVFHALSSRPFIQLLEQMSDYDDALLEELIEDREPATGALSFQVQNNIS